MFVETLALILTFSPGEKEQPLSDFRFANGRPANPAAGISVRRRMILLLLGREGRDEGGRETFFNATESGGERAAVQTLREVRRRPAGAKRSECAWL